MKLFRQALLILIVAVTVAAAPSGPAWRMKADYVEACSCDLFCPCYFNKHAQHPSCEFNMAVVVREGRSGSTDLTGARYWVTGDLGDKWGTQKKAKWAVVTFDKKTTTAQRDALAPMILKTYGFDWPELKVQEGTIDISRAGDIVEAKLDGGKVAYMKLKKEPGADGKGVVIKNVKYFNAVKNDGFELYKSIEHRSSIAGHHFKYSDKNAFLITIVSQESATPAAPAKAAKKAAD